jgi:hypothetical protein
VVFVLLALAVGPSGTVAKAAAQGAASPLPATDYTVHTVCAQPQPGHAGCLALRLLPRTSTARAHTHPLGFSRVIPGSVHPLSASEGGDGLRPQDLRGAYFPGEEPDAPASEPQTIALIDAYNDPQAQADLKVYDEEFSLPPCTTENGCFKQVNQNGEAGNLPIPKSKLEMETLDKSCQLTKKGRRSQELCAELWEAQEWAVEISTDIQVAHAVCENCHILLVEAQSAEYSALEVAEQTAVSLGANEISNSWGGREPAGENKAFQHEGVVITASAGDNGYLNWTQAKEGQSYYSGADYPASSPNVVAVGGTRLSLTPQGVWQSERVWNEDPDPQGGNQGAGGGGCSEVFPAPEWQLDVPDWSSVGCEARRAVSDVSADGDPYTGVAVYDSVPYPTEEEGTQTSEVIGWTPIGGTSVASPIIASMFALAGGSHGVAHPAQTLYWHLGTPALHDITVGGNGECDGVYTSCSGSMNPLSALDCGVGVLICNAAAGYDAPTGVGTPNGIAAFTPLTEAQAKQRAEEEAAVKHATEVREAEEAHAARAAREAAEAKQAQEKAEQAEAEKLAAKKIQEAQQAGGHLGGGPNGTANATKNGAGSTSQSGATSNGKSTTIVRLSALRLTHTATIALRRGGLLISALGFSFTISARALVRVRLYREGELGRLAPVGPTLSLLTAKGANRRHLHGRRTLPAGRYVLILTPASGATRRLKLLAG